MISMNGFSANDLFRALDGRSLSVSSRYWRIEVYGVFEQDGSSWVQLTLQGAPPYSLAMKISPHETVTEIVNALSSWLAYPSKSSGRVLVFGE